MHFKKTAYQGKLGEGFGAEFKDFIDDLRRHFIFEVRFVAILATNEAAANP